MAISVNATTIELTKKPEAFIEGTEVQYMCETDSAFPYPPSILWFVDDTPVLAKNEYTAVDNQSHGNYHGTKTHSTLRFTTKRAMNRKTVKCMLQNDHKKFEEHILNVKCKYLVAHILQKVDLNAFHFCSTLVPTILYL